jgi:hypothetical protein
VVHQSSNKFIFVAPLLCKAAPTTPKTLKAAVKATYVGRRTKFGRPETMLRQHSIRELLLAIQRLPATTPESNRLDFRGHRTHQAHWIGWLSEYNTEGFYGRSDTTVADARTVYQRLACGPILVWLNEAAGESLPLIRLAIRDMLMRGGGRAQTEAKIVRSHFPWERTASLLFR